MVHEVAKPNHGHSSSSVGEKAGLDASSSRARRQVSPARAAARTTLHVSSSEIPRSKVRVANVQAQRNDAENHPKIPSTQEEIELRPIIMFAMGDLDVSGTGVATRRWHKSTIPSPSFSPLSNLHSGDLPREEILDAHLHK